MPLDYNVPFADYLALPGVHFSALARMALSPLHYQRACAFDTADTSALRVGRVAHALILTPELPSDVVTYPGKVRNGKKWEAFKAEAEAAGQTIVKAGEFDTSRRMRDAVMRHGPARELIADGSGEVTATWDEAVPCPPAGHNTPRILRCRARFDWLNPGRGLIELKTTRYPPIPRAWAAEVARRYYHVQLAHYDAGLAEYDVGDAPVWWIVVENIPPYDVAVYRAPTETLEAGERLRQTWLAKIAECEASGVWPGVGGSEALTFTLPDYAAAEGLLDVDLDGIGGGDESSDT